MKTVQMLGLALALQGALAVATWWPSGTVQVAKTPLIAGGAEAITQLTVQGGAPGAAPVTVARQGEGWVISTQDGYPASAEKVSAMIDALGKAELGAPVATQASSHEKLRVGDTGFGRKVEIVAGNETITVFLASAASKAVWLRKAGGDDVWQVKGLTEFDFKDTAKALFPTNAVTVAADKLTQLEVTNANGAFALTKQGEAWSLADLPAGMEVDASKVRDLATKLGSLRLSEVIGRTPSPEQGFDAAPLRVGWVEKDGDTERRGSLVIGAEVDGKRFLQTEGGFVVQVPSAGLTTLLEARPEGLLRPEAPPEVPAAPAEVEGL
ncbi:MAG: hypothetical protein RLZZ383_1024 [Pseudomonadota bacterium]|jgi:hypothetical protein